MTEALFDSILLVAREGEKREALELGVLIGLPLILSLILLRVAKGRVANGAPSWQLWASLVPLLFGVWLGFQPFQDIQKDWYRDWNFVSDRSVMLHYAAFIVPCVAIVGIIAYILYSAHRERMEG